MSKKILKSVLVLWILFGVACSSEEPSNQGSEEDDHSGEGARTADAGNASSPDDDSDGDERGAPPSGESDGDNDETKAVSVGNPTDVGPGGGNPKMKFYIADAPIIDSALAFFINPLALELVRTDNSTVRFSLPTTAVDLLQYQNGNKHLLYEGDIPEGNYKEIRVVLDADHPATLIRQDGSPADVFVPTYKLFTLDLVPANGDERALFGGLSFSATTDSVTDLTMHVDLRRNLLPISINLPLGWLAFLAGAQYWLVPQVDLVLNEVVGILNGVNLLSIVAKYVCAYSADEPMPAESGPIPCVAAAGTGQVKSGVFFVPFLPAGDYKLRLFITDMIFLTIPGVFNVDAMHTSILDLSWL